MRVSVVEAVSVPKPYSYSPVRDPFESTAAIEYKQVSFVAIADENARNPVTAPAKVRAPVPVVVEVSSTPTSSECAIVFLVYVGIAVLERPTITLSTRSPLLKLQAQVIRVKSKLTLAWCSPK